MRVGLRKIALTDRVRSRCWVRCRGRRKGSILFQFRFNQNCGEFIKKQDLVAIRINIYFRV